MIENLIRRRAVLLLLIVSLAYALGLAFWLAGEPRLIGMDFSAYWRAAHQVPADVYAPRTSLPFPYPPTMLLWVAPLQLLPFWLAYAAFALLSLAAYGLAARAWLSREQLLLAVATPPIVNGLSVGQCSILLAAALLWACGDKNRFRAGVVVGLIASAKPQLVLMAPVMLLSRRDWRALSSAALAWSAIVAASLAVFGVSAWISWIASLANFHEILAGKDRIGMALSPAFAAEMLHWPPLPFLAAGFMLGLWLVWSARSAPAPVQCAAVASASLLSAPYAMVYDLAAVIPFLVPAIWTGSLVAAVAATGTIAPLSLPLAAIRLLTETASRRTARNQA